MEIAYSQQESDFTREESGHLIKTSKEIGNVKLYQVILKAFLCFTSWLVV